MKTATVTGILFFSAAFLTGGCTTDPTPEGTFSWENLHLPAETGYELCLEGDRLFVAAGHDGLFALDVSDSNAEWEHLGQEITEDQQPSSLGVRKIFASGNILYIRTAKTNDEGRWVGVWRSEDGGISWQAADHGMEYANGQSFIPSPSGFVVSPHDPDVLVAGSGNIFRSVNGGDQWNHVYPESFGSIFDPVFNLNWHSAKENIVWAYGQTGFFQPFLMISKDGGNRWIKFDSIGIPGENSFYSMAFDANDPDIIYVGAQGAVIRSKQGGDDWMNEQFVPPLFKDEGGRFFRALETHPVRSGVLFAGAGSRLYGSLDYGETKHVIETPPELEYISDLWYDKNSEHLYISGTGGVFLLRNPLIAIPN